MLVGFCSRTTRDVAVVAALVLFAAGTGLSIAQSAPKSPNGMPDIVGLYPGMPVSDAYNLMKAYYPTRGGRVDLHQDAIQGLNGNKPLPTQLHIPPADQQGTYDDLIDVFITLPPNKQAVWAVTRNISFEPGKSPSPEALVSGLRQKYGPEMPGSPVRTLRWIFDRQGKRVDDSFARKCNQISTGTADSMPRVLVYNPTVAQFGNLIVAPAGVAGAEGCKTFVYLEAYVQSAGASSGLMVSMYDLGMALNAGLRTQASIRGLANTQEMQAEQQQKKIDKSAVPKF